MIPKMDLIDMEVVVVIADNLPTFFVCFVSAFLLVLLFIERFQISVSKRKNFALLFFFIALFVFIYIGSESINSFFLNEDKRLTNDSREIAMVVLGIYGIMYGFLLQVSILHDSRRYLGESLIKYWMNNNVWVKNLRGWLFQVFFAIFLLIPFVDIFIEFSKFSFYDIVFKFWAISLILLVLYLTIALFSSVKVLYSFLSIDKHNLYFERRKVREYHAKNLYYLLYTSGQSADGYFGNYLVSLCKYDESDVIKEVVEVMDEFFSIALEDFWKWKKYLSRAKTTKLRNVYITASYWLKRLVSLKDGDFFFNERARLIVSCESLCTIENVHDRTMLALEKLAIKSKEINVSYEVFERFIKIAHSLLMLEIRLSVMIESLDEIDFEVESEEKMTKKLPYYYCENDYYNNYCKRNRSYFSVPHEVWDSVNSIPALVSIHDTFIANSEIYGLLEIAHEEVIKIRETKNLSCHWMLEDSNNLGVRFDLSEFYNCFFDKTIELVEKERMEQNSVYLTKPSLIGVNGKGALLYLRNCYFPKSNSIEQIKLISSYLSEEDKVFLVMFLVLYPDSTYREILTSEILKGVYHGVIELNGSVANVRKRLCDIPAMHRVHPDTIDWIFNNMSRKITAEMIEFILPSNGECARYDDKNIDLGKWLLLRRVMHDELNRDNEFDFLNLQFSNDSEKSINIYRRIFRILERSSDKYVRKLLIAILYNIGITFSDLKNNLVGDEDLKVLFTLHVEIEEVLRELNSGKYLLGKSALVKYVVIKSAEIKKSEKYYNMIDKPAFLKTIEAELQSNNIDIEQWVNYLCELIGNIQEVSLIEKKHMLDFCNNIFETSGPF